MFLILGILFTGISSGQSVAPRSFAPDGTVFSMKRKDNILYVGGGFNNVGIHTGGQAFFPNGSRFPEDRRAYIFGEVYASVPDGNGGRFVGGEFDRVNSTTVSNLVHILPDETVDPNFLPQVDGIVDVIVMWNDTMMFGGAFQNVNGTSRSYLAAFDMSTGTLTNWDPQPDGRVRAMKVIQDHVFVGGSFDKIGPYDQPTLAKIDRVTGESIYFLGPTGGTVFDMELENDLLYTVGDYTGASGYYTGKVAEISLFDDKPVYEFPATNGNVEVIVPDGNGGWFIGGSFSNVGGVSQRRIAHILPNYQLDPNFNPDPNSTVHAIAVFNDTMMFAGNFTQVGGQPRARLAAYDMTNNTLTPWNPGANSTVNALWVKGNQIFVGGAFSYLDSNFVSRLGMIDRVTGEVSQVNGPSSGNVNTFEEFGDKLYVGGSFNGSVGFNSGRFVSLTAEDSLPPWPLSEFNGTVETVISDGNGGWYVGGSFSKVADVTLRRLAHILPDGSLDTSFDFNPNNTVTSLLVFNDTMMVAGNFTQIGGQTRTRLAAIDLNAGTLTPFDPNVSSRIYDMVLKGDSLIIGGQFTTVGGQTRERLAILDKTTGALLPFAPSFNSTVYALAWNDTMMYVGGQFFQVNGQGHNRLANFNLVTGAQGGLNPNPNNAIYDILLDGDEMYLGGSFTSVGGQSRGRTASIDMNNFNLTSWNPDANNWVNKLVAWNDTMMLAGRFTQIGGQDIRYVSQVNQNTGIPFSWRINPNNAVNTAAYANGKIALGGTFNVVQSEDRKRLFTIDLSTMGLTDFDPDINGTIEDLAVFHDTMMFAGSFTQVNGLTRQRVAGIEINSGAVYSFNMDIDNTVFSIAWFNDTMMLGGRFDNINGEEIYGLAAVNPVMSDLFDWKPTPSAQVKTIAQVGNRFAAGGDFVCFQNNTRNRGMSIDIMQDSVHTWHPDITGSFFFSANCMHIEDSLVYIGGRFSTVGDSTVSNLAAVDKTFGVSTGQSIPIDDKVWDVTVKGDSLLFVGEFLAVDGTFRRFGAGVHRNTWNLNNWRPRLKDDGLLLENVNGELQIGGRFDMTNNYPRKNGYALNLVTKEILDWNPNPNSIITDIEFDKDGDRVYVAGGFSTIGGAPSAQFAALDPFSGLADSTWDLDISGQVRDIAIHPLTDAVYLVGSFTSVAGQNREYLAGIDKDANLLPLSMDFDSDIRHVAFNDTIMYISGDFENINGSPRYKLASLFPGGQLRKWAPENDVPFFSEFGEIKSSPNKIFLAGSFDEINATPRKRIAAVGPVKGIIDKWNPKLDGNVFSVNEIYPIGEDVFVGGSFEGARGTPVKGLARFDVETGIIQKPLIRTRNVFAMESFDDQLFIAGDYDSINQFYQPNLSAIQFKPGKFSSRVEKVLPDQGGDNGDITLTIIGYGFQPGSKVILRAPGVDDIVSLDSSVTVKAGRQIEASFILRGEPLGIRDVIVEVPGDTTFVIEDGFEIVPGDEPDVWVSALTPSLIRNLSTQFFHVNFGNKANIDAVGVPVWVLLPEKFNVQAFSLRILRNDSSAVPPGQVPEFVKIDSIQGQPFPGDLYVFIIPKIPAGTSGQLSIRYRPFGAGPFRYRVAVSKPMFGSPIKFFAGECADEVISNLVGLIPGGGCALGVMELYLCPLLDAADPESGFGSGDYMLDYAGMLAETVVTCALDASVVGGVVADILKILMQAQANGDLYEACTEQFGPDDQGSGGGNVSVAIDPNNKIGLAGQGGLGWINTDKVFSYVINFENADSATAAAQIVTITDTLDTQVYDLSTLELNLFTLADSLYKLPKGLQSYDQIIDLRPRLPMYARVQADLDTTEGILTWTFTSLDTVNLELLNDPVLGLLPPNTDGVSGTGSVFYTLLPYENTQTGTTFINKASIVFDMEAAIITDPWINTADNDIPFSQVDPLPDTSQTNQLSLTWSGGDIGSGIKHYHIYMSQDGSQPIPIAYETSDSSLLVEVDPGATYTFFSVAYDTALNRELRPLTPDARTYVPLGVNTDPIVEDFSVNVFPNPNNGRFQVELQSPRQGNVTVSLSNLLGQEVYRAVWDLQPGQTRKEIQVDLPTGIYHFKVNRPDAMVIRKIEIK
ncbi:MAG: T9SS type A sorting domain-containing protein [Bacteroidota bacterium]